MTTDRLLTAQTRLGPVVGKLATARARWAQDPATARAKAEEALGDLREAGGLIAAELEGQPAPEPGSIPAIDPPTPPTPGAPAIIRLKTNIRVPPSGTVTLRDGQIVADADLFGRLIRIEGDESQLLGCRIGGTPDGQVLLGIHRCRGARVAYCLIEEVGGRGIGVSGDPREAGFGAVIERNHFRKWKPGKRRQVREAVQLGMTSSHTKTKLGAVLRFNLFTDIEAERELVSVKSSLNLVEWNTVRDCDKSFISNRHGGGNIIQFNWFEGKSGIVALDGPGRLIGNRGGVIEAMEGDVEPERWGGKGVKGYPPAHDWLLRGNACKVIASSQKRRLKPRGIVQEEGEVEMARALAAAEVGLEAWRAAA